MKNHLVLLATAACVGGSFPPSLVAARLVFDQPSVVIELPIDTQETKAVFLFRNTSQFAVRILEVKTECDCIQTSIPTDGIEPGKTGEVTLKFRSKLRNGADLIRAKVVADNGEIQEISMNAKLRSYIDVIPLMLRWRKGERRESKEFVVSATGLGKLHFSKVAAVKDSKVEVHQSQDPSTIRVHVTPPAGDSPFREVLLVSALVEGTNETKVYDLLVDGE